jgi:hypothetical protein
VGGRNLFDEARVRGLPDGGELVLGPGDVATPSALDRAFAKGIRVRWRGERAAAAAAAPPAAPGLFGRMLAEDGTYVVTVRAGRATVHRLTDAGPQPVKEP